MALARAAASSRPLPSLSDAGGVGNFLRLDLLYHPIPFDSSLTASLVRPQPGNPKLPSAYLAAAGLFRPLCALAQPRRHLVVILSSPPRRRSRGALPPPPRRRVRGALPPPPRRRVRGALPPPPRRRSRGALHIRGRVALHVQRISGCPMRPRLQPMWLRAVTGSSLSRWTRGRRRSTAARGDAFFLGRYYCRALHVLNNSILLRDLLGSSISASPREKLLDSPSSSSLSGRYVPPLHVSAGHESEVRKAERLLRLMSERHNDFFLRLHRKIYHRKIPKRGGRLLLKSAPILGMERPIHKLHEHKLPQVNWSLHCRQCCMSASLLTT